VARSAASKRAASTSCDEKTNWCYLTPPQTANRLSSFPAPLHQRLASDAGAASVSRWPCEVLRLDTNVLRLCACACAVSRGGITLTRALHQASARAWAAPVCRDGAAARRTPHAGPNDTWRRHHPQRHAVPCPSATSGTRQLSACGLFASSASARQASLTRARPEVKRSQATPAVNMHEPALASACHAAALNTHLADEQPAGRAEQKRRCTRARH
jgi:hypothetical protein